MEINSREYFSLYMATGSISEVGTSLIVSYRTCIRSSTVKVKCEGCVNHVTLQCQVTGEVGCLQSEGEIGPFSMTLSLELTARSIVLKLRAFPHI